MKFLADLAERLKRRPRDVVGIDIGTTGTKVARLHRASDGVVLQAADVLDPIAPGGNGGEGLPPLDLPQRLRARYAALVVSTDEAVIRLLSFPGSFDAKAEERIVQNMGIPDADRFRIGYTVTTEGHGRGESRVLAVALPDERAGAAAALLSVGIPAPFSLEVAGLAGLCTFTRGPGREHASDAVGAMAIGARTTTLALFNRGTLGLVRRFSFGTAELITHIQEALSVDESTAAGILADGSFDISQSVSEAIGPLMKQLVVSRDFLERRENCRVSRMYVSGGVAQSRDVMSEIQSALGVDATTWSPLDVENLSVAKGAIPDRLAGQEWRLADAVGACLGALEQT